MKILLWLLIAGLVFTLYSCTVVGFALGAANDAKLPKQDSLYIGWHRPAKDDYLIRVALNDGRSYEGRFLNYQEGEIQLRVKKQGPVQFPIAAVERTTVLRQKREGKWIGLAVGAAIDAIIVFIAATSITVGPFYLGG